VRRIFAYTILNHSAFSGSRVAVALAGLELSASPFAIGLILSFYSLLPLFLSVAGGRWVDRVGMRLPMLLGSVLLAFGVSVPFLAWDIGSLYLSSITVGLGFMGFHICTQKAAGDLGGAARRKENFSLLAIGYSVSGFLGPTLAGLSIDYLGFRTAFALLTALPCITFLLIWRYPLRTPGAVDVSIANADVAPNTTAHPNAAVDSHPEHATATGKLSDLFQNPALRRLFIVVVLISASWDVHQFMVPLYGAQHGLSASAIGLVLGTYAVATFVIRLALPWLSRRYSEWRLILVAMWTAFAVYAVYPWFPTLPVMLVLSFVLGLGLGMCQPMILSALHRYAPEGRVGEAVGLRMTLVSATQTVLPTAFGALGSGFGLAPLFVAMSLLVLGGAIVVRRGLPDEELLRGTGRAATAATPAAQEQAQAQAQEKL
jgi:MFS family permease